MKVVCISEKPGITVGRAYDAEELFAKRLSAEERAKVYHITNDFGEETYYWSESLIAQIEWRDRILSNIGII